MDKIPESYIDLLVQIRKKTEAYWQNLENDPESKNDDSCWVKGAKWQPLTNQQIDEVEKKYNVKFTPEHRAFLLLLHSIDKKEVNYYEGETEGQMEVVEEPYFYNWLRDEKEIRDYLDWPERTIFQDVSGMNRVWLKSWGKRPESNEERLKIFRDWYNRAPKLLPITAHRFLVSDISLADRPVLSVWGSDIIVYGWSLKSFLLMEFKWALDLMVPYYDEEYQEWDEDLCQELKDYFKREYEAAMHKDLPFWKEMILFWSSGWRSFGLAYPGYDPSRPQPIMAMYNPENEDSEIGQQKRFNDFTTGEEFTG
ncbi:MAG: SMI1/KNR4 family protein [Sediminibacterium sp.]|nr:SMI1/KNR4 family protein [Sediminibacterium sp.]